MLIGQYSHALDDKNRVSLPVKFRKELGKKLVLAPGLDSCIFLFTENSWKEIATSLSQFSMLQSDNRSFNRFMLGGAVEVEVDSAGRILLPDFLQDRINLKTKDKVVFIGVQNRVEIWGESAWNSYRAKVEKEADVLAEKLGNAGILSL